MSRAAAAMKAIQPLVVVVAGGGPVGLTFSLNLTMMMVNKRK
jgi:threonine dehydrogenase-like Zn-dependent dehydrogenase